MVFGFGKKKKEEFPEAPVGLKDNLGLELEEPEEQPPLGMPPGAGMPGFSAPQQQPQYSQKEREYEVLSAKLDALKAILDSINQRIENLERIARGEHEKYY